jgi:hypothetical protein
VQYLVRVDAQPTGGLLGLRAAPLGERPPAHLVVPRVAVGQRDELHGVPLLGEQGRRAARLYVAVVRMGPDEENPDLIPVVLRTHVAPTQRQQEHEKKGSGRAKSWKDVHHGEAMDESSRQNLYGIPLWPRAASFGFPRRFSW